MSKKKKKKKKKKKIRDAIASEIVSFDNRSRDQKAWDEYYADCVERGYDPRKGSGGSFLYRKG